VAWTGDVWKLLPILKRHRQDLKVQVLDCASTGMVVISGLDPESQVLKAAYTAILSEWLDMSLGQFGVERFLAEFPLEPAQNALTRSLQP
jgi:hypothetical protein